MLKFSKDSWHYRIANLGGNPYHAHGLCEYVHEFIKGLLLFVISTVLLGLIVIENLIGIVAFFQGNWSLGDSPALFALVNVCTLAVIIIVGIATGWIELKERRDDKARAARYDENGDYIEQPYREPSFLRAWWDSVHEKICPVVEFYDPKGVAKPE